jgi:hypothetical protein
MIHEVAKLEGVDEKIRVKRIKDEIVIHEWSINGHWRGEEMYNRGTVQDEPTMG